MNQPWIYMCSTSWAPLPLPSPSHPSGSSQCTNPEHLSPTSHLGWWSVSHSIVYLFQCYSDTCTPMFIAALFIIVRTWKQPRCPSADEWIRKLWYIYTMEYYSAIKKNTFESVLMRCMKLEPIIQSEISQKDKDPGLWLLFFICLFPPLGSCPM